MTNSPPPDPRSSQTNPLGFDEFIGIFVAFTTIGAILFWALSHRNEGFNLTSIVEPSPSPAVQSTTPTPGATASPTLVSPVPTVAPTESPEVLTPVPSRTTVGPRIPAVIPLRTTTTPAKPKEPPKPAPTQPITQPIKFLDVPDDFWARPYIDALSARSIITGFAGKYFRPTQPVTRAEFATLLQEAFNINPPQIAANKFKDVPSDFWATPAIDLATKSRFLKGYPGDVFRPEQEISRAQALVALASGLNLATKSSPTQTLQSYQDAAQIPKYATEKIAAATEAGLVVNHPNPKLLNPNGAATRAEVAAIIYQALVRSGRVEPIQSQYTVKVNP